MASFRLSVTVTLVILLVLFLLSACGPGGNGGQSAEDPAVKAKSDLARALHEGRKDIALSHVLIARQEYYDWLFTTLGEQGMDRYGAKLDALTLSTRSPNRAIFVGEWTSTGKTRNVTATFLQTDSGEWKLAELD